MGRKGRKGRKGRMDSHRRLPVWRDAQQLVTLVYKLVDTLPARERFVADPQLRRAAWSVHNNVAEGNAKLGRAERRRYFDSAVGSLAEVDGMVDTLGRLYQLNAALTDPILQLRRDINAQVFALLRRPGR